MAQNLRYHDEGLFFDDLHSFLQVNRALYACLNRMLWKDASKHEWSTQRVLTHLFSTDNLPYLKVFLELGADVAVHLPDLSFESAGLNVISTPLIVTAELNHVQSARLLLEKSAKAQYSDDPTANSAPCTLRSRPRWCSCSWTTTRTPIWRMTTTIGLHWYASREDIGAMRAILLHGAEVNGIGTTEAGGVGRSMRLYGSIWTSWNY
jgi:hypothetical protein